MSMLSFCGFLQQRCGCTEDRMQDDVPTVIAFLCIDQSEQSAFSIPPVQDTRSQSCISDGSNGVILTDGQG